MQLSFFCSPHPIFSIEYWEIEKHATQTFSWRVEPPTWFLAEANLIETDNTEKLNVANNFCLWLFALYFFSWDVGVILNKVKIIFTLDKCCSSVLKANCPVKVTTFLNREALLIVLYASLDYQALIYHFKNKIKDMPYNWRLPFLFARFLYKLFTRSLRRLASDFFFHCIPTTTWQRERK